MPPTVEQIGMLVPETSDENSFVAGAVRNLRQAFDESGMPIQHERKIAGCPDQLFFGYDCIADHGIRTTVFQNDKLATYGRHILVQSRAKSFGRHHDGPGMMEAPVDPFSDAHFDLHHKVRHRCQEVVDIIDDRHMRMLPQEAELRRRNGALAPDMSEAKRLPRTDQFHFAVGNLVVGNHVAREKGVEEWFDPDLTDEIVGVERQHARAVCVTHMNIRGRPKHALGPLKPLCGSLPALGSQTDRYFRSEFARSLPSPYLAVAGPGAEASSKLACDDLRVVCSELVGKFARLSP